MSVKGKRQGEPTKARQTGPKKSAADKAAEKEAKAVAKGKANDAEAAPLLGHNALTDDEDHALIQRHAREWLSFEAAFKKAQADLKNCGKRIKAEGHSTTEVKLYIKLSSDEGVAAFEEEEAMRAKIAGWQGVGVQIEMFADREPSVDKAFKQGKKRGLGGEVALTPGIDGYLPGTEQFKAWTEGWHKGQEVLFNKGIKAPAASTPSIASEPPEPDEDEFPPPSEAAQEAPLGPAE